jgi:tetratricopeptide (TPR) repeat protein
VLKNADFDWLGAEGEYRRALAPNESRAKAALADLLATLGDVESAIKLMRDVITNEPLRINLHGLLSGYLSAVNRLDEAEQAIGRAIELQPATPGNHWQLAAIEVQRGHAPPRTACRSNRSTTPPGRGNKSIPAGHYQCLKAAAAIERSRALCEFVAPVPPGTQQREWKGQSNSLPYRQSQSQNERPTRGGPFDDRVLALMFEVSISKFLL